MQDAINDQPRLHDGIVLHLERSDGIGHPSRDDVVAVGGMKDDANKDPKIIDALCKTTTD